ncbi:MAG TPA: hypothetical protein VHJ17_25685 [Thermomonospora sp.]|nr:hypothetical protein [Thermomonospora sp.]
MQPVLPARIAEQLAEIRERWGDVLTARLPGTPRPWAEPTLTPEERALRDAQARAERQERLQLVRQGIDPAGYARSAAREDVLDVIVEVEHGLVLLEDAVRERLGRTRLCERCRHEADEHREACRVTGCSCPGHRLARGLGVAPRATVPPGAMHWACVWLTDQLPAIVTDATLAEHVADEVARLHRLVLGVLGLVENGTLIKAPCIGCDGVTPEQPEGGALTLRLYADGYVLCHNPLCDPPTDLCGSRLRGRPMWPYEELEWLAARLDDRARYMRKRSM